MCAGNGTPYDETPNEEWFKAVESWEWQKIDKDTWKKSGECLVCLHQIDFLLSKIYSLDLSTEAEFPEEVLIICNCGETHEGRADDMEPKGCGQAGYFSPPKE